MSKRQVLMLLGVAVILLQPGLGFPESWDRALLIVAGVLVVALAYSVKPEAKPKAPDEALPYSEHRQGPDAS